MSKSHANVLSFVENDSYLSNLYERKEHFLQEISIENMRNIGTIDGFMMRNQRTLSATMTKFVSF